MAKRINRGDDINRYNTQKTIEYKGQVPKVVTVEQWENIVNVVKKTDKYQKLYKNEVIKTEDFLDLIYTTKEVWLQKPQIIKNEETGEVITEIPGVLNKKESECLPPKFVWEQYWKELSAHGLYLSETPNLKGFTEFNWEMKFPPRKEQQELAQKAEKYLQTTRCLNGLVKCAPGWGKAQPHSEIIQTPNGFKTMGEIKVGDYVIGSNGKPTKVLNVYPQGVQDTYKVTFGDGTSTRCNKEHLWYVQDYGRKWKTLTLNEIMSKNYVIDEPDRRAKESESKRYRYFIPLTKPVEYDKKELKIHPYVMGCLLGDGCFRHKGNKVGFSDKNDKNINGILDLINIDHYKKVNNDWILTDKTLKDNIKEYNLDNKLSVEKHIPWQYLYSSIEDRKQLLQGLVDTDGYIRTKTSWSISTSSEELKDNILQLSRSLGYFVTVKINKNPEYTYNDIEKFSEHTNYEININYKKVKKPIVSIEKVQSEEQSCISVEAKDKLYLTTDFIVTHNTFISIYIGCLTKTRMLVVVPNKLLQEQWVGSLKEFSNLEEEDIGMIKGSDLKKLTRYGEMQKPVLIATIQSLDSQLKRKSPEELIEFYKDVGCVFYDEAHTSGSADGYAKTSSMFTTNIILGLSATPYNKNRNLFQLYTSIGEMFYVSLHQNLIPTCNMNLMPITISRKDNSNMFYAYQNNHNYFRTLLEEYLYNRDDYFEYIADWLDFRLKQGHNVVILFQTNQMLNKLSTIVEKRGHEHVVLTGKTNTVENQKKMRGIRVILSNFKMFSAGADYPHLSCIFFCSLILGKKAIIQSLGRTTRAYKDKIQDVQAHFFLPKFIYPYFSQNEPHNTIKNSVLTDYPQSAFKWNKEFRDYFAEKKGALQNAQDYKSFQQQGLDTSSQYQNQVVNGFISHDNRLQQKVTNNPFRNPFQ